MENLRVFNESKTEEVTEYDPQKGYIKPDRLFFKHHEAINAVEEKGHYETICEYPNGGKDVEWIVDVAGVEACEARDEYEDIYVYKPYSSEELEKRELFDFRFRRETECFSIVNRGAPWYARLTEAQRTELDAWYTAWLNVTETKVAPEKPAWLEEML